jgi:hypothetical protein
MDRMRCDLMPGMLNGLAIEKFTVDGGVDFLRGLAWYQDRAPVPGTYTKLVERNHNHPQGGTLWMSDTPAEMLDHLPAARQMSDPDVERVLINGLGLGCVVNVALSFPHIRRIDVVENDLRVVRLVGKQLPRKIGQSQLIIHEDDAYDIEWGDSDYFDVIWHDIWPNLSTENLAEMDRLFHKYVKISGWQGFWGRDVCVNRWLEEAALFKQVKKEHGGHLPRPLREAWKAHQAEKQYAEAVYD